MADGLDLLAQAGVSAVTAGAVAYVTSVWRTNGEIRKLRAERDETHYSHRQANYHNLLNAERKMHAVLREGQTPPQGPPGWVHIKDTFREAVNGVIISGSDEVVKWARELDHAYFFGSVSRAESDKPRGVPGINWSKRDEARRSFIDAVRDDLGAPGARRV